MLTVQECSGRFDTSRGWLKVLHATRHPKTLFHYGPYAGVLLCVRHVGRFVHVHADLTVTQICSHRVRRFKCLVNSELS